MLYAGRGWGASSSSTEALTMALFKKSKLKLRGTAIGSTGAKARSARMGAAGAQVHFPSDGFTVSGARVSPPGDEAAAVGIDETPGAVQPAAPCNKCLHRRLLARAPQLGALWSWGWGRVVALVEAVSTFLTQSDYSNLESCYARLVAYIGSFGLSMGGARPSSTRLIAICR